MFTVSRHASKHVLRPWTRSFAQVVNDRRRGTSQEGSSRKTSSQTRESPPVKVPVREDHGLYAFFRRKKGDHLAGEDRYEVFETPEEGQMITGASLVSSCRKSYSKARRESLGSLRTTKQKFQGFTHSVVCCSTRKECSRHPAGGDQANGCHPSRSTILSRERPQRKSDPPTQFYPKVSAYDASVGKLWPVSSWC